MIGKDDQFEYFESIEGNSEEESDMDCESANLITNEPTTYYEAMNSTEKQCWKKTINEELDAHEKCGIWKLIRRSKIDKKVPIIKARWIHRKKQENDGSERFKSRLVAKGYVDKNDYDRTEIYAPVARMGDVRFIFSVVNKFDLELTQMDVKQRF